MKKHIPNLLTFGNLFCGFLAISYIINGDLRNAPILIFIAIMLDAIDGRMARILGVSNELGKELDSLADIVSFGVAPALMVANTYLSDFGMAGNLAAGLFPLFGAYRLARFNISDFTQSLRFFKGIPITFAGGIVTFLVLFAKTIPLGIFLILFYLLAILMVSRIKIPSFKKIGFPKYGILINLFLFYLLYLFVKSRFEQIPIYFYLALATYILYIVVRFFKEKDPRFPIRRRKLPKRFKWKLRKTKG
jgi:CDP-diacylglycerol---serine O-phosphatidyltransferase